MSQLALRGGQPVYAGTWPTWPIHDECDAQRVDRVVRSGNWGWCGPEETEFRANFSKFLGAKFGLCVTNGTHALQLALEALDVGAGDEVIVPGLTWQATAACALDVNAVPVLVDCEPATLCMDPAALRKAITPRTRAIIPVHLYSCTADMDAIMSIANEHSIPVIEDCSHQHGSEWRGRKVGSIGAIGCFSLQNSKLLTSGEGGFITTSDERLFRRLDSLRNCGRFDWTLTDNELAPQSGNYRFTEFQAAVLNCGLARLPEQNARRDENAQYLSKLLREIPGIMPPLRRPQVTRQAYYAYAFRYEGAHFAGLPRSVFIQALHAETGYPWGGTYDPLNHSPLYRPHTKRRHHLNEEYWKQIDPARFNLPHSKSAFEQIVTGLHYFLLAGKREMEIVVEAIGKIQKHASELMTPEPGVAA